MTNVIEVRGVCKAFEIPSVRRETVREHAFALFRPRAFERLQVLQEVSLEVKRGETVGIMGRNGSGKSTLLKIICGIFQADRGEVSVRGSITPILELGLGWNPELDAIDNILLLGTVMGLSLGDARAATDEILDFAGLARFANMTLKHYSSGMAMRLAYAVAFHAVQETLVLDEVFAVGDLPFRQRCEERYLALARSGHTGLIVSHAPEHVLKFCQRAILIDGGRVQADGRPEDVVRAYEALSANQPVGG